METATIHFWTYWYFHIPNYLLAVLLYTLIGRFTLSLFVPPDWPNYIWRAFKALTEWALPPVRFITPALIHYGFLPLVAAFWVLVLRAVFGVAMTVAGLAPSLQSAS